MDHSSRARSASPNSASENVKKRESSGATASKRGILAGLKSYVTHHRESYAATIGRLIDDKAQTLTTSLVVAVALALPAFLMVALANLEQLGESWDTEPKLSLYLNDRAKPAAVERLLEQLQADARVDELRYISADDALKEFEAFSGFGLVLQGLDTNPLPASIELSLTLDAQSVSSQKALADQWANNALVDDVAIDLLWVERFLALTSLARTIAMFLAGLLGVGALLAIGNTVRLIIENRKEEIVVVKLVGGTDGFVRRPLLYTGAAYGCLGAVLAVMLVQGVLLGLSSSAEGLASSYQSVFRLTGLGFDGAVRLVLIGAAVGWLGALLAVQRHLGAIEPT